jgi:diphosphomevalonate decarboxylase
MAGIKQINTQGLVAWHSPSNIAIIKYWGKKPGQVPLNPSLSFSLKNSFTQTSVRFSPKSGGGIDFSYKFEGEANLPFSEKIRKYLSSVKTNLPFLSDYFFSIESRNSFPHSAGIASSASSMSALAFCLGSIAMKTGNLREPDFFTEVSSLARMGSGSAARSVYGGWVAWGASPALPGSSDEVAVPFNQPVHPVFRNLNDSILIVDSSKKLVTSSEGHRLMDEHPLKDERIRQANRNFARLVEVLEMGDFAQFAAIAEEEATSIHRLMETSDPPYSLLKPATLEIIGRIQTYRETSGFPVCFTLDAGPNVHVIYPGEVRVEIQQFIKNDLLRFCENNRWIDDQMGAGPVQLNNDEKI